MAERNVYHVSPSNDGQWIARMNDDGESHRFASRDAALNDAQQRVTRRGAGDVFIHRPDGTIEERLSVGDQGRAAEPEVTPSKAAIAGHPIHPMLIPFPIAFLVALPIADVVFAISGEPFWAQAAFVLLCAGLVTGALAALVGAVDFLGLKAVRNKRVAWWHLLANGAAIGLVVVNLFVRLGDRADGILPAGLILSVITAGLLAVGGWFGGELAYRHRIGVAR